MGAKASVFELSWRARLQWLGRLLEHIMQIGRVALDAEDFYYFNSIYQLQYTQKGQRLHTILLEVQLLSAQPSGS